MLSVDITVVTNISASRTSPISASTVSHAQPKYLNVYTDIGVSLNASIYAVVDSMYDLMNSHAPSGDAQFLVSAIPVTGIISVPSVAFASFVG